MTIESPPLPPRSSRRTWVFDLLLIYVLLMGAYFRVNGLFWGEYQYLHPDERFLVWVGSDITPVKCLDSAYTPTNCPPEQKKWIGLDEYFDAANSSLNPNNRGHGFYVYGTLPMFITRYAVEWIFGHSGFDEMTQVGRSLSALADLLTVLFVYLVAVRLYDRRVGILAAAFSAAAVLQIQQSHFFTMDTFISFFSLLAFYFAVRVLFDHREWNEGFHFSNLLRHPMFLPSLGFGIALGMAVASKLNAAPMAVVLPVAMAVRIARLPAQDRRTHAIQALLFLFLAAFASLLVFRIAQPYAFSGPGFFGLKLNPQWVANIRDLRAQSNGDVDFPPAMQWARRPVWFSFKNLVLWGLGLPLGILAWVGFLWVGWRMLKGEWQRHILIWGWTALYFGWQSLALNPTMRYQLPIYPMLAIFAGWAVVALYDQGRRAAASDLLPASGGRVFKILAFVVGFSVLLTTFGYAYAFSHIYSRPITRVEASRWILRNIPGPINLQIQSLEGVYNQPLPFAYGGTINAGAPYVASFAPKRSGVLSEIYLPNVESRQGESIIRNLTLTVSTQPDGEQPLARASITSDFTVSENGTGGDYTLALDQPVSLEEDQVYYLRLELEGEEKAAAIDGPVTLHIQTLDGVTGDQVLPDMAGTIQPDMPYLTEFVASSNGVLYEVYLQNVTSGESSLADLKTITVSLAMPGEELATLEATLTPDNHPGGQGYILSLDEPIPVAEGDHYTLSLGMSPEGAISLSGAGIANEGEWDDGLPLRMDGYDPFGGIYPLELNFNMYWDDTPEKLERFTRILDEAEYIVFSSNRQWGTLPRLPERFPMTTVYYRSLLGCPPERTIHWCYSVARPGMFQGELGYELVKTFQSEPSLGPLRLNDQFAEEAFTVYDHPKVFIFKKTAGYDPEQPRAILGAVDFTQVVRVPPMRAGSQPANLMLPSERLAEQRTGGTWSELFDTQAPQNRFQALGVLVWYLSVFLLGLIAYPLLRLAFPGLADGGYPLARTAGLLILSYLVWLAGSFSIPFTRLTISIAIGVMAVIGAILAYRKRDELGVELRERGRYFLAIEGLALAFFLFDLLIRFGNPDIWHPFKGGEKPMDFSYFNAILKSSSFPPYDPWYAGGYLNYYYYGFVLVGTLVKWLGIVPAVAYNLILPTLFSLMALGAFSLAWNLYIASTKGRRPVDDGEWADAGEGPPIGVYELSHSKRPGPFAFWVGLAGAVGMAVLGNLGTVRMIIHGYQRLAAPGGEIEAAGILTRAVWTVRGFLSVLSGTPLPYGMGDWYWIPSRAIPPQGDVEPITEFPFFTILYADPHAHMFALPVTLLALAFALSVVLSRGRWRGLVGMVAGFGIGGMAIGALRPTNTWDFYPYLALGIVAIGYSLWCYFCPSGQTLRVLPFLRTLPDASRRLLAATSGMLAVAGLAFLLYQPFAQWYGQAYGAINLWRGPHTPLVSYLTHWGLFLFVIVSWMVWETREWLASTPLSSVRKLEPYQSLILGSVGLLAIGVLLLLLLKVSIAWFVLPLAAWAGVLILRPGQPDARRFVLFLVGTALVLSLMVEVIVLRGDIGRMNTVFKFYLQGWTLFAISAAAALGWTLPELPAWLPRWRAAWTVVLIALVAGAALFPLLGGLGKIRDRMVAEAPHTLDGMAFMNYAHYDWQGDMDLSQDYRAIRWMQENVPGSPVIVEANLRDLYRWGSRFTIYTGLPGVVGWEWHQQQQRAIVPGSWISSRIAEIDQFYTTTDLEEAQSFLRKYDVKYIIVGQLEYHHYPGPGLEKFPAANGVLWSEVYRDGQTAIYQVGDLS